MSLIAYLDYNATTPVRARVRARVLDVLDQFGNPSSIHRPGRAARAVVEDARDLVAAAVGVTAGRVVFTSGGTEANTLALRGLSKALGCRTVVVSAIEHPSVLAHGTSGMTVGVDARGVIDLAALDATLARSPAPALVAVMLANNETGVIQPIADVVEIARRHGARVHCDAVQAFGKIPVRIADLGVDSLSVSAHKIGGLKGAGALILAKGVEPAADLIGGGQERRRRAGTENTVGIAAFGAAAEDMPLLLADVPRVTALRDEMESAVRRIAPQAQIFGAATARLGNTSSLALPGATSETQLIALDMAGVAVSAGSACSSGKIAASHVLLAMGVDPSLANCALRVSLGWETTAIDVERFETAWSVLAARHLPLAAIASA